MIVVRPAAADEAQVLADIGLAAWRRGIGPQLPKNVVSRIERHNPFVPFLDALGPRVVVGEYEGAPAGIGASEYDDDTISDLWVAPGLEGRGVGSAIMAALGVAIAERGHAEARIQVAAANARARRLYQHLGYRESWRKPVSDRILGITLEKIGLRKRL